MAPEESSEPFLNRSEERRGSAESTDDDDDEYYRGHDESCAGCRVELLKRADSGVPVKHVFFISIVTLCAALPISSLFPFLYFMVRDFHIAEREEDISYFAGYVGSSFMLGRALTSVLWGVIADRYGRRPVGHIQYPFWP